MDPLFQPLRFRSLTVKNRLFRSNIAGRFDYYNGSGSQARINFEERFAKGGVGAILSSHAPVHIRGRILPNYATIDSDERIAFWRRVGEKVHEYDCAYILQLSHGGRQRDIPGVENDNNRGLSSTSRPDPLHGFLCQAMTRDEIAQVIGYFAAAARRARLAGLDGVELHACNGYLITQFLSSAINDRKDEYGGSLENRARFLLDIVRAIRREVGDDFHLQVKLSAADHNNAVAFWEKKGNTLPDPAFSPSPPPLQSALVSHPTAPGRRHHRRGRSSDQTPGRHPGRVYGRLSNGVGHPPAAGGRLLRRRLYGPRPGRQSRPAQALRRRDGLAAETVHLLQQMPAACGRGSLWLLRPPPL